MYSPRNLMLDEEGNLKQDTFYQKQSWAEGIMTSILFALLAGLIMVAARSSIW